MDEIRARIVSQEKGLYRIASDFGEKPAEISGKLRFDAVSAADYPAVGDYVVASWPEDESRAIISMIYPRKSSFVRKAAGKENREQIVAANIDFVFICMSMNNDFNIRRLERYLATAWDSGATPIVLLTKKDLCEDPQSLITQAEDCAAMVDVYAVSALDESPELVLGLMKPGKTYAFIGSSGVGKSTLINRLTGRSDLKTNGLRSDDKGRHTTTHRELINLENGAFVIDTPGMRELGMWNHEEGIDAVFSDIEELVSLCRFPDCSHTKEPGCAVQEALRNGKLDEDRWNSYLKLKTENEYISAQGDYLRAKKEKFKNIAIANKRNKSR